jgi:radical SAM protein with 4Fe4S-binding SPASM domain
LLDFIQYAKSSNIAERLIVSSNGSLVSKKHHASICESGLDYLRISIYGGREEIHARNTQTHIRLEKIRKNIMDLKSYRDVKGLSHPYIYVKMIELPDKEENKYFLDYFSEAADEIQLEPVMNWNDPDEGNLSGIATDDLLKTPFFSNRKKVCPFPFYMLVIHSDLRVSVCCADWNKKTIIGNLKDKTLSEIWNGARLREFQILHLQGKRHELEGCRTCTFLYTTPDNMDTLSAEEFAARLQSC